MSIRFDYDFGLKAVIICDMPIGSRVVINGTKYVPERTCKNLATREDDFACSECKCEVVGCMVDDFGSFDNPLRFSYCPNCGRKVVE